MSALAEPLPAVLSADEANARKERGQREALRLEKRLARQYESSLRATAKRCAEAYRERTQVLFAAAGWNESAHPRNPATGRDNKESPSDGGKFASKKEVSREGIHGGHQAEMVERVKYEDGTEVVEKKISPQGANSEELAAKVMEAIGAPHPEVFILAPDRIATEFVEGQVGNDVVGRMTGNGYDEQVPGVTDSDAGHLIGVADIVMGNSDRHHGNWILTPDGPVGIDNSNSFKFTRYASENKSDFGKERLLGPSSPFAVPIVKTNRYGEITGYKPNRLTKADVTVIRARIKALKSEYERLGFSDAYVESLAQIDALEKQAKGTTNLVAPVRAASPTPHHSQPPQPTVDEVMKAELAAASATARTQATRRKIVQAVAGEILAGFGPEPQLRGLLEPLVRRQAGVQAERLVEGTRDAVANILLDALTEGWSVPETAGQIQSVLAEQAAWRATMLARTDLISLSNGAAQEAATILGDAGPQYKTWLTAGDERVRESHVDANRQTVGINEPFNVGESLLQYPGDPAGTDADTINCRCVSIFSDSPAPTLRHTQDGGIEDGIAVLASAALDELLAAAFDPAKHPHQPAGTSKGGEWAPVDYTTHSALDEYTKGGMHGPAARLLRGNPKTNENLPHRVAETEDFIRRLDQQFVDEGEVLQKAETVYRGTPIAPVSLPIPGDTWVEPGYTSTTSNIESNYLKQGTRLIISLPPGTPVLRANEFSEHETLLPRGAKFTITNIIDDFYWEVLLTGFDPKPLTSAAYVEEKHPRNPKGKREGGRWRSLAELQNSHDHVDSGVTEWGDAISVHSIEAHPVGEGHGAAFLRDVIAYSEQTGKPLYLTPGQVGSEGLTTAQLEAWYGRHGFRWQGKKMVRQPMEAAMAVQAAAVDFTDGTMIALYPAEEEAATLAALGDQPAEDLHVTLAFLPEGMTDEQAVAVAPFFAAITQRAPLAGVVGGVGVFAKGDNGHPIIALPSVDGLNELRAQVVQALNAAGVSYSRDYGFVPHMTLSYENEPRFVAEAVGQPVTFAALSAVRGPAREDFTFSAPTESRAAA